MSLYDLLINDFEVTDDLSVLIRDIGTKEIWKEMKGKSWSGETGYLHDLHKTIPNEQKTKDVNIFIATTGFINKLCLLTQYSFVVLNWLLFLFEYF